MIFSVLFGLEDEKVRDRRVPGDVFESAEILAIQPDDIGFLRLKFDAYQTGLFVAEILRRPDQLRERLL